MSTIPHTNIITSQGYRSSFLITRHLKVELKVADVIRRKSVADFSNSIPCNTVLKRYKSVIESYKVFLIKIFIVKESIHMTR